MIWISVAILIASLFYWKFIKPMNYWKERGVPQGNPKWIVGNSWGTLMRKQSFPDMIVELYSLHPKSRYVGIYQFNLPTLILRSPELIRQIAVKDFEHFLDHKPFVPDEIDPLWSNNLFALRGEKWRIMRATLSPAFTSSKMKSMFALMSECGERFVEYLQEKIDVKETLSVEMKDLFTRYTNDVIATTAFSITCNSLKHQQNEFFLMGKDATSFKSLRKKINLIIYIVWPSLAKILGLRLFSDAVRRFFTKIIKETVQIREEKGTVRPDMLHLLLEARKGRLVYDEISTRNSTEFAAVEESHVGRSTTNKKKEISDLDITAQALIFFFAGFETSSVLMCFSTYELAVHPEIQERLYQEIKGAGGDFSYDAIQKMKYLDMVLSETLRKWPPIIAVDRICVKPYTIKSESPEERPVHLVVDDVIWLPIFGLHHDETYFPNPEKFDPERFSDENKQKIVPYSYLPFGAGPRNCIGSRFALLETKVVLCNLLSKFEVTVIDKTPIPMKICKKSFNLTSETGFWVGLKPRKDS